MGTVWNGDIGIWFEELGDADARDVEVRYRKVVKGEIVL